MLATLIPLFDKDMKVCAYSLFSQKENLLLSPAHQASAVNDGAARVDGLDILQSIGIDTLSPGTDVFLPVGSIAVFSDIEAQSEAMLGRLVLLFDNSIANTEDYRRRLKQLKEKGYKLAIRKLPVMEFENYSDILSLMDYIFLDCKKVDVFKAKIYFGHQFPKIKICVGNIERQEAFDALKEDKAFCLFEGAFYRIPVTKGQTEVELRVNSEVTSIRHAAVILGQRELKKWINTVITRELCADRPNEITRVSLLRAKHLECLAPSFGMGMKASELFLLGLFSVLDIILSVPMEEALNKVNVSRDIRDALLNHKGEFADIYDFMIAYENADWQEVSRMLIVKNVDNDAVYKAYIDAVCWYKEMFF